MVFRPDAEHHEARDDHARKRPSRQRSSGRAQHIVTAWWRRASSTGLGLVEAVGKLLFERRLPRKTFSRWTAPEQGQVSAWRTVSRTPGPVAGLDGVSRFGTLVGRSRRERMKARVASMTDCDGRTWTTSELHRTVQIEEECAVGTAKPKPKITKAVKLCCRHRRCIAPERRGPVLRNRAVFWQMFSVSAATATN